MTVREAAADPAVAMGATELSAKQLKVRQQLGTAEEKARLAEEVAQDGCTPKRVRMVGEDQVV